MSEPRAESFVVERPWGRFEQFTSGQPVTVKIITVDPGCRLSLQRHQHRAEAWYVLDVPMDVHVDGEDRQVAPGDRVLVPKGATHRLGNSQDRPGRILEICYGEFDEADIERLQDDYAR